MGLHPHQAVGEAGVLHMAAAVVEVGLTTTTIREVEAGMEETTIIREVEADMIIREVEAGLEETITTMLEERSEEDIMEEEEGHHINPHVTQRSIIITIPLLVGDKQKNTSCIIVLCIVIQQVLAILLPSLLLYI